VARDGRSFTLGPFSTSPGSLERRPKSFKDENIYLEHTVTLLSLSKEQGKVEVAGGGPYREKVEWVIHATRERWGGLIGRLENVLGMWGSFSHA